MSLNLIIPRKIPSINGCNIKKGRRIPIIFKYGIISPFPAIDNRCLSFNNNNTVPIITQIHKEKMKSIANL